MKVCVRFLCSVTALLALASSGISQTPKKGPSSPHTPASLERTAAYDKIVEAAVSSTLKQYESKGIRPESVAATVIDLSSDGKLPYGEFRGEQKIYPASVVKMFYMVVLQRFFEDGKAKWTKELDRGERDMIVDSSNEATQYIVDVLTGTHSGPELPAKQFAEWSYRRNTMNRYFAALGYRNINVNQKTHCEDAYGIEQQFRNYKGENRNMITTNATARLMAEIALGKTNSAERTAHMMRLLSRDPFRTDGKDEQATEFIGIALRERGLQGAKLYSKAGWTSRSRHDAAYIETPDGRKLVIAVYTEGFANEKGIIPAIAGRVLDALKRN